LPEQWVTTMGLPGEIVVHDECNRVRLEEQQPNPAKPNDPNLLSYSINQPVIARHFINFTITVGESAISVSNTVVYESTVEFGFKRIMKDWIHIILNYTRDSTPPIRPLGGIAREVRGMDPTKPRRCRAHRNLNPGQFHPASPRDPLPIVVVLADRKNNLPRPDSPCPCA